MGYDNLFWRGDQTKRIALFADEVKQNSFRVTVSQSSWPLDAPVDFLTRSVVPSIIDAGNQVLRASNSAGELQNGYFHTFTGSVVAANLELAYQNLVPSALYARKHMLPGPNSIVSPSGIPVPQTSAIYTDNFADVVSLFAGEALWEAPTQAGIVVKNAAGGTSYESHPSEPWFKDYDDFREDLQLVSRGYAIVPEFRVSEHVDDYEKQGINPNNKYDTFEIVGTNKSSSQSNFYKDFSNSEFMKEFLNIQETTYLEPTEIMLVCSASIRLVPYKGFYPAQRSVQLVRRFKDSFGLALMGQTSGAASKNAADGTLRPLMQSLFSPGVLYNTIKSGIAVDYPIVSDILKTRKQFYGANEPREATTWMFGTEKAPPITP